MIDLIKMKAIFWNKEDQGVTFEYEKIPEHLIDDCNIMREKIIEEAVEASDGADGKVS